MRRAEAAGLDLVEVAPNARPPVCKILDYGRFKYEQKKKLKHRTKNVSSVVKEVRVRPKIDVHDLDIKIRKAREFLEEGYKVQVTCLFRGREMAYQDLGRQVLMKVAEAVEDLAKVERQPRLEGRRMNLMLSRKPGAPKKASKEQAAAPTEGGAPSEPAPAGSAAPTAAADPAPSGSGEPAAPPSPSPSEGGDRTSGQPPEPPADA